MLNKSYHFHLLLLFAGHLCDSWAVGFQKSKICAYFFLSFGIHRKIIMDPHKLYIVEKRKTLSSKIFHFFSIKTVVSEIRNSKPETWNLKFEVKLETWSEMKRNSKLRNLEIYLHIDMYHLIFNCSSNRTKLWCQKLETQNSKLEVMIFLSVAWCYNLY